ncbi:DUF1772 domain-containing protein [uncultured Psychroserpens sp.]|uniref:anthrone oxygenase family protein n=1 Tax=uncultured Psychroserpens sp. TaxID=255436 RepID=UPI002626ACEB|nr:DUF1772 domain-containing protein [uncultured Psychroserpens sp.]
MEFNLETSLVLITITLTGLTAGLCFTWTNAITPGIGQLDDIGYLQAFQQMNKAIINPTFIIIFFGPFVSNMILIYLKYQNLDKSFWLFVAAAALFILGVASVTVFKNVPLNEILDKTDLASATTEELKVLRQKFENPWKQWHLVRTISSITSFVLLLIGLLLTNQSS